MSEPRWRKSSRSTSSSNCVEVATNLAHTVGIRDSKDADGPVLTVPRTAWAGFVAGLKSGGI